MIVFLLLTFAIDIIPTDSYRNITSLNVCVNQEKAYLISFNGRKVFTFDLASGQLVSTIRNGEGPGEVMSPMAVTCGRDSVWIRGFVLSHQFDSKGTYIKRINLGMDEPVTFQYKHGWYRETAEDYPNFVISLLSHDFKKVLWQIQYPNPTPPNSKLRYAPSPRQAFDVFHNLGYISNPAGDELLILNLETATVKQRITLDLEKVPYRPEDWHNPFSKTVTFFTSKLNDYEDPEFFPPINALATSPEGHVMLLTFDKRPGKQVLAFDIDTGEPRETLIKSEAGFRHFLGKRNGDLYAFGYRDGEVVLLKLNVENYEATVQKYANYED